MKETCYSFSGGPYWIFSLADNRIESTNDVEEYYLSISKEAPFNA